MKVVIFGATGGIGSELLKLYKNDEVVGVSRRDLDFYDNKFKDNFKTFKKYTRLIDEADIIINSAGVLGNNSDKYNTVFDVNFNSNWVLISYLMSHKPKKTKKFIMIGSTSYNHGRDDYMLYSASKAALFNLFQGALKYFEKSKLIIGLVNPRSVKTKMTAHLKGDFLSATDCAKLIYDFIQSLETSKFIDLV